MKVNELSKELNVTNKEIITFLKENEYKISSHMQSLTDEMIDLVKKNFSTNKSIKESNVNISNKKEEVINSKTISKTDSEMNSKNTVKIETKTFKSDDMIPCRSVTPWELIALGVDKTTIYHWNYFGDVDYVSYKDLQSLRRTSYITKPKILIEDADLCYQWRKELGDTYKYFLGVEYPEEFFDLSDDEFANILKNAPDVLKEVIKVTAMSMIKNENYPTIQKITLIDSILGTSLKDFI